MTEKFNFTENDPHKTENVFHPHTIKESISLKNIEDEGLQGAILDYIQKIDIDRKKRLGIIAVEREKALKSLDELEREIDSSDALAIKDSLTDEEKIIVSREDASNEIERERINRYIHELDFERDELENRRAD